MKHQQKRLLFMFAVLVVMVRNGQPVVVTMADPKISIAEDFIDEIRLITKMIYQPYRKMINDTGNFLAKNDSVLVSDQECLRLIQTMLTDPFGREWSAKLIDSTGSILGSGLLSGTYTSFGDYDSCLKIQVYEPGIDIHSMSAQYCLVTVSLPRNLSQLNDNYDGVENHRLERDQHQDPYVWWKRKILKRWLEINSRFSIANGLCLPSICRERFVRDLFQNAFPPLGRLKFDVGFCQTPNVSQFADWFTTKIILRIVLGLIFLIVTIGTVMDVFLNDDEKKDSIKPIISTTPTTSNRSITIVNILKCFSLSSNIRSLFVVTERSEKFRWIDGWRSWLTLIVTICHVSANHSIIQLSPVSPFVHYPDDYQRQTETLINRYIVNSTFSIKSFFMMSGFLLAINYNRKRRPFPSFFRYILIRWLRFVPSFFGYLILTLLFAFSGNGPLFHQNMIEPYIKPCIDNLAPHLLFINNWFNYKQMCGFQTWYISADFQLYSLAFFVLLLHRYNFKYFGHILSIILIISSYIIILIIFLFKIHGIPSFLSVVYPQLPIADRGYLLYWTATYNHLEAYFFGIIIGTIIGKHNSFNPSKALIKTLLRSCQIMLFIIPHLFPWFLRDPSQRSVWNLVNSYSWFDAIILTGAHILWLLSIGLIFYIAATYPYIARNDLGLRILSASCFVPFARISFALYLVHVPVTWFLVHQSRFPQLRNEFGLTQFCLLAIFISVLAAISIHLLFELPFAKLSELIFNRRKQNSKLTNNNSSEDHQLGKSTPNDAESESI